MPIYEYACQACRHRFEVRQKFSDPPVESCERCGKAVQRVISPPAIMFKGSGWYITDYSDKLKAPGESSSANGSTNGTAESKKESSPAPAAPASTSSSSSSPSASTSSNGSGSSS